MAGVWKDHPVVSTHDHAVYLLVGELPLCRDARGEITQALVGYVGGKVAGLGCTWFRHLHRTIRLRHAIGAPKIVGPAGFVRISRELELDPVVRAVICELCDEWPKEWSSHEIRHMVMEGNIWIGYALVDIYWRRPLALDWEDDIALCDGVRSWMDPMYWLR